MVDISVKTSKFIITKLSKVCFLLEDAYSGPSCDEADIPYGKIYLNKEEAVYDLNKLRKYNKITPFKIVELG